MTDTEPGTQYRPTSPGENVSLEKSIERTLQKGEKFLPHFWAWSVVASLGVPGLLL